MLRLLKSSTLRATAAFAVAGVAHALATLLLARQLPEIQFAYVALFLALLDFGGPIGTGGADTIVVRYKLAASGELSRRVLATGLAAGVLVYFISRELYGFSAPLALITGFAIVVGARNRVAASIWQSMQKFGFALLQLQSSHLVLALLAVTAIVFGWQTALIICILHTAYLAVLGSIGWRRTRHSRPEDDTDLERYPWHECIPIVVITAVTQLSLQAERLLIPHLLHIEELALYGVLAAVVGSPFHMLQIGVGYTLMPRLKSLGSTMQRASVLRHEALFVSILSIAGAFFVWLLGPWVAHLFVGDKFILTTPLVLAAILVGFGKVGNAFFVAIVKALGSADDLKHLATIGWLGLGVSVFAAWLLAANGLAGLLIGIATGWAARIVLNAVLARKVAGK